MPNFGDPVGQDSSTRIQVKDYFNKVQKGNWYWGGTSGGSANAHTVTVEGGFTVPEEGQLVAFIPGNINTGAATLSVNGETARSVVKQSGNDVREGDLHSSDLAIVMRKGTTYVLVSADGKRGIDWTPILGAGGTMGYSSTTITLARYIMINRFVFFALNVSGTTVTPAHTDLLASLPVPFSSSNMSGSGTVRNVGSFETGRWLLSGGNFVIRRAGDANWGLGANTGYNLTGCYQASA